MTKYDNLSDREIVNEWHRPKNGLGEVLETLLLLGHGRVIDAYKRIVTQLEARILELSQHPTAKRVGGEAVPLDVKPIRTNATPKNVIMFRRAKDESE